MRIQRSKSCDELACLRGCFLLGVRSRQVVLLVAVALVVWAGVVPTAKAQCACDLTYVFTGEEESDWLGNSVSGAGDVNDDEIPDLIVGAPFNNEGGDEAGRAYVYSGATGAVIWTFTGGAEGAELGYSVSGTGDVNLDGFADVIVGSIENGVEPVGTGKAYIYSGQTGGVHCTLTGEVNGDWFGYSVSEIGKYTVIVGAPHNDAGGNNAGRAYVYLGTNCALLHTFTGEAEGDNFGNSVSGAGDVNNDGTADIIVGARYNDGGANNAGRAYVYSGVTYEVLWIFTGEAEDDHFGWSVSGAGDVDNDDFADLIVGASYNDVGGTDAGRAYVYSGRTGDLLYTFTGQAEGDHFGHRVSGAGDVNDDGFADLLVGAPYHDAAGTDAGRAYVYSGLTGEPLYTFDGEAENDIFGYSVSGAGDVDGDDFDDQIIGAPWNDAGGTHAGRAYVYTCEPTLLCGDCNGNGLVEVGDVVFLITYLYRGGDPPNPLCLGDVNCDGVVGPGDVVYLITYLFRWGPAPCDPDDDGVPDC